ncbi:MAG: nitroreductase family protein [candidate division KSB1 bacterium]|nr:nitroreductase family protein [candidate division KSB1 bacterium]
MTDTLDTIYARHSVRRFQDKPVPQQDIQTILNAANQAPSAHNQQSWKFIIIEGDKKQGLADLVSEASKSFDRPSHSLLRMAGRSIQSAPTVIAVANTGELVQRGAELFKVDAASGLDFFRTMEIQSSAAAVENMLLAATSLGLGTVWLGILYLIKDKVLRYLNEPAGEFMAVVPVGYPAKTTKGPRKKPLDNVVKAL